MILVVDFNPQIYVWTNTSVDIVRAFRHACINNPYVFLTWGIFFLSIIPDTIADSLFSFSWTAFEILHWSMYVCQFEKSEGLEGLLEYIKQNYGNPPIYILENGLSLNML